jgi:hypothetical protein
MSVQIRIQRNNGKVSFDAPSGIDQNDLVFWHNYDSEAHFPVPGCKGLKVGPGENSKPFQPAPNVELAVLIQYGCALHDTEEGELTVGSGTGKVPEEPAGSDDPKRIQISAGGKFETVNVYQSQLVYWENNDSTTHFPVPNCTGLLVQRGKSSNALQPAPAPNLPMTFVYGCAMAGHENEQGTINVYNDFVLVENPTELTAKDPSTTIVRGGKSPYVIEQDPTLPMLHLFENAPAGSSSGISIGVVNWQQTPKGTLNYEVHVTDALGSTFWTPVAIPLSEKGQKS